jgi:hypothetical protein
MKGISPEVIAVKAECDYKNGIFEGNLTKLIKIYEDIYNGQSIEFDLCSSSRPSFEFTQGVVKTRKQFIREIKIN